MRIVRHLAGRFSLFLNIRLEKSIENVKPEMKKKIDGRWSYMIERSDNNYYYIILARVLLREYMFHYTDNK